MLTHIRAPLAIGLLNTFNEKFKNEVAQDLQRYLKRKKGASVYSNNMITSGAAEFSTED